MLCSDSDLASFYKISVRTCALFIFKSGFQYSTLLRTVCFMFDSSKHHSLQLVRTIICQKKGAS